MMYPLVGIFCLAYSESTLKLLFLFICHEIDVVFVCDLKTKNKSERIMKKFIGVTLFGLLLSVGTANALPILSHAEDSSGFMVFNVDATNEPSDMVSLQVYEMQGVDMLGGDLGAMRAARDGRPFYLEAVDETPDDLISFLFEPTLSGDAGYHGIVHYSDGAFEQFTYYLPSTDPNDLPPATSVPEPSTFLLLGAGLIGMMGVRSRKV
jgi:hypothetical protein